MDIFWLEAVVRELDGRVTDTRISKIHQPTADTLIFRLWSGRETLRLLVSLDSRFSRLHLTTRAYPNPFTPPRFCQLLRSRLSALTAIRQRADERIVECAFRGKADDYLLIAELTGRHSNLILVDEAGRIVDALKRVDGADQARSIQPGAAYRYPPRQQRLALRREVPVVTGAIASAEAFRRWLLAELSPMSKAQAAVLSDAVAHGATPQAVLQAFREDLLAGAYQPRLIEHAGKQRLQLFPAKTHEAALVKTFAGVSEALDAYYYPLQFQSGQIGDGHELESLIRREIKKLRKRREHIAAEEQQKSDYDARRQWGDLLLANLHLIRRGMEEVEVIDYTRTPPAPVSIRLDARLSPQENAEACFRRYKKEKRGMGHVSRRLQETDDELAWFEGLALALEDADGPEALQEIRQELLEAGLLRPQRPDPLRRRAPLAAPKLNRALSPSGLTVLWGRNNRSNDEISTRRTANEDLWFHVHNQPGCHLVLKRGERKGELPREDIVFAAALAAGYSRGRHDHKVEVMVAEGKAVHKPKGVRPGLVTVNAYRTLLVAPLRLEENAE
jgi:predicted ribosome quality control (RQC) complex YloA/Tae2 family protein